MTSTPTGSGPLLQPDDVFLVGKKKTGGYDNKTIDYDSLKQELNVNIAQLKIEGNSHRPGKLGLMFPNDTLEYNQATGEVGINFDTTGFNLKGFLKQNPSGPDADGINSDPSGPPKDSVVGDFYLVTEGGVVLSSPKWGLEKIDFEVSTGNEGAGYQSNNGTFKSSGFDANPDIDGKLVLTYTVVDGVCTNVEYDPADNAAFDPNILDGIKSLTCKFSDVNAHALTPVVLIVTFTPNPPGSTDPVPDPIFDVGSAGMGIIIGPEATKTNNLLTNVKVDPVDPSIPEGDFYIDVKLTPDGNLEEVLRSNYQYGYDEGTEWVVSGHPTDYITGIGSPGSKGQVVINSDPNIDDAFPVYLNDKIILSKTGWQYLPDAVAREAVFDVQQELHPPGTFDGSGNDISGTPITPALIIQQQDKVAESDPLVLEMRIEDANSSDSGLLPADLYDKLVGLQGHFGSVDEILPKPMLNVEQLLSGDSDDNAINFNVEVKELEKFDSNGNAIDLSELKDVEIGLTSAKIVGSYTDADGHTAPEGRMEGTVFIITKEEVEKDIDFANNDIYYNGVPNAELLAYNYSQANAEPYTVDPLDNEISRVKISGGNEFKTGESLDLTAEAFLTCEMPYTISSVKWYIDGGNTVDGDSNYLVYRLDDTTFSDTGLYTLTCEIDGVTEDHYVHFLKS